MPTSDFHANDQYFAGSREYYVSAGGTIFFKGLKVIFLMALIGLTTWRGAWDWLMTAMVVVVAYFVVNDLLNTWRNWSRPFITLHSDRFVVGRPEVSIPYAEVERYAFEQGRRSQPSVIFFLFPRVDWPVTVIKGGGPVYVKDGRIVCRMTMLGRKVTAGEFFADFEARLAAAGATDAYADRDKVVNLDAVTGEATVMPKGRLAWLMRQIGGVDRQREVKWFSFRLGTAVAVFLAAEIYALTKILGHPRTSFDIMGSVIGPFILGPFFVTLLAVAAQALLIEILDRTKRIAGFMERAGEMKKFFLGATVGLVLSFMVGGLILAAFILLWPLM